MLEQMRKGIRCISENGFLYTFNRLGYKLRKRNLAKKLRELPWPTEEELYTQKSAAFSKNFKISILTPLYNTPLSFLKEMIASVQAQTYSNWELCLCDGSDAEHNEVGEYCKALSASDNRIVYKRLTKNAGISENTNACFDISTGEYIGILDHDDVLHPSALYEVMKVIAESSADFIYTDEAKFSDDVKRFYDPNFKPDFAKDDLRAHNYICHFLVVHRNLLKQTGLYKSEFDGSQDHDAVLRMTECAKNIVHIPKILYFWRVHKGSVSAGVEVKMYAVDSAHRAVSAQLERSGENGKVSSITPYKTLYKVDYELADNPLVSVIIYGESSLQDLFRCVDALEKQATYYPIEVCIIESTSDSKEFKDKLRMLPTVKPILVVTKDEQKTTTSALSLALQKIHGEYVVFLHSLAVLETKSWVEELLMYAQRKDIGAVGAKIFDPQRAIFSAGVALDADSSDLLHDMFRGEKFGSHGYEAGLCHVRNVSAVRGQCIMVARKKLSEIGDIGEELGKYSFVDACLKLSDAGYRNVWNPFVSVMYWGSGETDSEAKNRFLRKWKTELKLPDPYYNPNVKELMIF